MGSLTMCLYSGVCFGSVGIEARGFIFGPPIALAIGAKFVPLRKPRKLPGNFHLYFQLYKFMYISHLVKCAIKCMDC